MTEGASERETPGLRPGPRPGPPSPRPAPPQAAPADEDGPDPRVQAVLSDLEKLAELPVGEHLAVYERVHAKLREVLQTAGQQPPETP
ncbi:hypothetical protein [Mumia sp.]|uniref:hypothetical protein n=1 Tax=Mumia sp. TaxID=1965300 RepID=UPI00261B5560|nr:hypothetical protein [Mumia sp.]MDD9348187.1 hypothetical protein [Mumia sp.]